MSKYPHDEFDDIDENTARRGIYRGTIDDPAKDPRGAIPLVTAGVIALLLGASMYVMAPRYSSPNSAGSKAYAGKAAASPSGNAPKTDGGNKSGSAQPSQSSSQSSTSGTVAVYNASAPSGSASRAAAKLKSYTISETGNWPGNPPQSSTVYYKSGAQQQAQQVANAVGISNVQEGTAEDLGSNDTVVVLASDFQS